MADVEPTVFVVDDDVAVCEGLQALLESEGLRSATYLSAEAFVAAYRPGQPGCLVLDIRMHGMNGLELQAWLARQQFGLPVIIISGHGNIPMTVQAMQTGALDFLEKPVDPQLLLERIRVALDAEQRTRGEQAQRRALAERLACLTPRERHVLERVVAGKANKEIAAELGVSVKTVEAHRRQVMLKMGVTKAVALAKLVMNGGAPLSSGAIGDGAAGGAPAG
jgi:FixJ family two-component response regulator